MNPILKSRLKAMGTGASAVAIAMVFGAWFEGTGPTRKDAAGATQYRAYRDTGGVWTACHGVTGPAIVPGRWYTQAECTVLEGAAYRRAEAGARRLFVRYDTYSRWMQASLIDMVYNLGESKLADSTIRRKLNSGDDAGGCTEMLRWNKGRVGGRLVVLPGLELRRDASTELCTTWGDAE